MSLKQTVARNVLWNWIGTATHMLAGFITFPVLIQRLGQSDCGLWLLIISLTAYMDLLDLGLRGSLGRNIAFFRAKNDDQGVNVVFNTGLALLGTGALLVLLVTVLAPSVFFGLFEVRPEAQADVRLAIWLVGLNLALVFLFNSFQGFLWGHQRFDLINTIDIPCIILRTVLAIALIGPGSDSLVTLALIHVIITVIHGTGMAYFSFMTNRNLRIGRRFVQFGATKQLFDFGIWVLLLSLANVMSGQLGPFLVGNQLQIMLVTAFNAAARLVNYVKIILMSTTGVLTPLATAWHAEEDHVRQQWLFVQGGKACMALALFFLGGFFFLGDSFLRLWTGRELEFAWMLLMILMLGELLPLSQWVTYSTVIGMNRHRLWACMSLLEVGLIAALAVVLLSLDRSLLSIGLAVAIPGALCRGLIQMIYACRLLKVPLTTYLRHAMLPPLLVAVLPVALLGLLTGWHMPASWPELVGYGLGYTVVYVALAVLVLVGYRALKQFGEGLFVREPAPATESPAAETLAQTTPSAPALR